VSPAFLYPTGPAPRAEGWRARAEQVHGGGLVPDPSWTLTASEIGGYTFCPKAWYFQQCRVPVTATAEERRRSDSGMHRQVGRQTDLVRAADALRTVLLLTIGALLAVLVAAVAHRPTCIQVIEKQSGGN
jgi:hypothetical protein